MEESLSPGRSRVGGKMVSCVSHPLCLTWLLYNSVAMPRRQLCPGKRAGLEVGIWERSSCHGT